MSNVKTSLDAQSQPSCLGDAQYLFIETSRDNSINTYKH